MQQKEQTNERQQERKSKVPHNTKNNVNVFLFKNYSCLPPSLPPSLPPFLPSLTKKTCFNVIQSKASCHRLQHLHLLLAARPGGREGGRERGSENEYVETVSRTFVFSSRLALEGGREGGREGGEGARMSMWKLSPGPSSSPRGSPWREGRREGREQG
jgi:hypothetical protein